MKTEGNEPITAVTEIRTTNIGRSECSEQVFHNGLTKREHFAAMAMSGYMGYEFAQHQNPENVAKYSVECADALIAELNKATG